MALFFLPTTFSLTHVENPPKKDHDGDNGDQNHSNTQIFEIDIHISSYHPNKDLPALSPKMVGNPTMWGAPSYKVVYKPH